MMSPSSMPTMVYDADLYKDNNNSLGMSLMGDSALGIFVKGMYPADGSAARSGKIQTGSSISFRTVFAIAHEKYTFDCIGDRLLSINDRPVDGMDVQQVADTLSVIPNPCRLKLSRPNIAMRSPKQNLPRPISVAGDSFFRQQDYDKNSPNSLIVCIRVHISLRITTGHFLCSI
jgi:hypothetical protein